MGVFKTWKYYFKPKRNVVYDLFNSCVQESGESVNSFITRLSKLAASCEFGQLTDELIRDWLVIGLIDKSVKANLLREKNLDLNKGVQVCTSSELASGQLKRMTREEKSNLVENVKKIGHSNNNKNKHPQQKSRPSSQKSTKSEADYKSTMAAKKYKYWSQTPREQGGLPNLR